MAYLNLPSAVKKVFDLVLCTSLTFKIKKKLRILQKFGLVNYLEIYIFVRIPIRNAFPDYTGKPLVDQSLEFIQNRFKEQRKQGPVCISVNFKGVYREEHNWIP